MIVNWCYIITWQKGARCYIITWPKRNCQFHLSPMESRYQLGPGLLNCRPGQPTAWQACSRKVPAVTTPTLSHNATEARSFCLQRSGEALELGQRMREPSPLLPPSPSGDWLWESHFITTLTTLTERQKRWEKAVNSIDFLHSSCKAWSTINKLTGRSVCSSRLCSVSVNSITSQLVKNGPHKTGILEPTTRTNKELSDQW